MDSWMYVARKVTGAALLPPSGPLMLLMAGLILARRRRILGFGLAWSAAASLLFLSVPWFAAVLTILVGGVSRPISGADLRTSQAIVVLGGGLRSGAMEFGDDAPSTLTLERIRYAAFLARRASIPLLVSGGATTGGRPEADVMADMLEDEYQVPVRWRESRSRNTRENALFSAQLLKSAGISRIAVVSHAVDARRAQREFRAVGITAIAAPTVIPDLGLELPWDLVPSMRALYASYLACYELLGNIAAWVVGR